MLTTSVCLDPESSAILCSSHSNATAVLPSGRTVGITILELCPEEARLSLDEVVRPGDLLLVQLHSRGEIIWDSVAKVHWCELDGRLSTAGVYFREEIPREYLLWPTWEQRERIRYPIDLSAVIWWDGADKGQPVTITNYSSSGIGVTSSSPGTLGREALIIVDDPRRPPVSLRGSACWQVAEEDSVLIGFDLPNLQGRKLAGTIVVVQ